MVDCSAKFPEAKDDVPKCLIRPQLKDIQLTVREEERKPENIEDDDGITELWMFSPQKILLIKYQNSCQ